MATHRFPCLVLLTLAQSLYPALQYPGCGELSQSDFKFTVLQSKSAGPDKSIHEPIQMDFEPAVMGDGNSTAYVYYIERRGLVKLFNPFDSTVRTIATLTTTSVNDHGLLGIALDPHFHHSRWLYLYYSEKDSLKMRLSRFTLSPSRLVELASEKVILSFPCKKRDYPTAYHVGGPMAFDGYGDLWLTVGNNSPSYGTHIDEGDAHNSDEATASNTADLRGGILRIHPLRFPDTDTPLPGIGRTYSIPAGNFGPHFAESYRAAGSEALAAMYADPARVRPELYTKGHRSNFSITVDPVTRQMAWGEANPGSRDDEFNLVTSPVFAGYPYFMGNNSPTTGHSFTPAAPKNHSKWNKGIIELPPVPLPASGDYNKGGGASAMAGPIYRYDGALKSSGKLPPHLDGFWLVGEYVQDWIKAFQLNAKGESIEAMHDIFPTGVFHSPLDLHIGPDGALYVINYDGYYSSGPNTGIMKVTYTGDCRPAAPVSPKTGCMDKSHPAYSAASAGHDSVACQIASALAPPRAVNIGKWLRLHKERIQITLEGELKIKIFNLKGKCLQAVTCRGPCHIPIQKTFSGGLLLIRVYTANTSHLALLPPRYYFRRR